MHCLQCSGALVPYACQGLALIQMGGGRKNGSGLSVYTKFCTPSHLSSTSSRSGEKTHLELELNQSSAVCRPERLQMAIIQGQGNPVLSIVAAFYGPTLYLIG